MRYQWQSDSREKNGPWAPFLILAVPTAPVSIESRVKGNYLG